MPDDDLQIADAEVDEAQDAMAAVSDLTGVATEETPEAGEAEEPAPATEEVSTGPAPMSAADHYRRRREMRELQAERDYLRDLTQALLRDSPAARAATEEQPTEEEPVYEDVHPGIQRFLRDQLERSLKPITSYVERLQGMEHEGDQISRRRAETQGWLDNLSQLDQEWEQQSPGYSQRVQAYTEHIRGFAADLVQQVGLDPQIGERLVTMELVGIARTAEQLGIHPAAFADHVIQTLATFTLPANGAPPAPAAKRKSQPSRGGAADAASRAAAAGMTVGGGGDGAPGADPGEVNLDLIRERGVPPEVMVRWRREGVLGEKLAQLAAQAGEYWEE